MAKIPIELTAFLLSSILLFILVRILRERRTNKPNLPPGPRPFPLIGNLHLLGNHPHISLQRLAKLYGPIFHLSLGEIPTVIISSARTAREVLRTHDLPLSSRPKIYSAMKLFYGCTDMAFSPYGPYWRHVRKICILELLSMKRVESYASSRAEEVSRMIDRVAASGNRVELSRVLGLYANGVLCKAAFGKDFAGGGDYERHGFVKMLEEYQELLGGLSVGDFFPSWEWIHVVTGMKSRLESTSSRFDRLFDEIIEEHRERKRRGGKVEGKDLVDVLLDLKEEGGMEMPLTIDNIKALILDMFAAGTDTTFITLDWGMTELIINPKAMKRAQDEVRDIVGDRKIVLETDLPQMHYLKAVIKEIFRLHPPAPVLVPRESMEHVSIDGYDIPAKTRIFVNAWAIGRDPESWVNPELFDPDRFIGSSIDFRGLDYELIPFGAGRRGCPGITFGVASIELALAQLLHSFDWELPAGVRAEDLAMTEVFGITMHRKEKLVVVAKPHFSSNAST
uniref:Cytochrome P450 71A1 n=1 Tax=Fritillaria cirrhosa TaxID=108544 RepID=A0A1L7H7V2_9LILI|nr:cytochrome P450 71A1 [Fritillaria cirrhosa]